MLNEAIAAIATIATTTATNVAGLLLHQMHAICQSHINNSTAQSFGGAEECFRAVCVRSMS